METSKDISTQKGKYINTDSGRDQSGSIKLYYAAVLFGEPDRITTTNSGRAANSIKINVIEIVSKSSRFMRLLGIKSSTLLTVRSN